MIAGIAIDAYKLPVFRKRLDEAKYSYAEHPGVAGTILLKVETWDLIALQKVVEAANKESREGKTE